MKNYINQFKLLLGITCVSALFTGCSDDFLKPDPLSLYEPTVTFNTVDGLNAALASADKALRAYWTNTEACDLMLPLMSEYLFSDLTVAGKTDDQLAFCDINERFTPTDGWYNFDQNRLVIFWGETYNGIKYANTVISYIDKVEGLDETTRNEFLGRAYFHRAYRYMNLCFQFGGVPFVSKIIESPKQDYKSTKREAIIKRMVQDMEFAVQNVPDQKDMTYIGMINKGACRQLLIKCYLANGDFQKAKEQADILIDQSGYSLMQDEFGTFPILILKHGILPTMLFGIYTKVETKLLPLTKRPSLFCPTVTALIQVFAPVLCVTWFPDGMLMRLKLPIM